MAVVDDIIGLGWSFPPAFDPGTAEVVMTSGIEDIERSLEIIFSTALGERLMNPSFGCALDAYVFESMTTGLLAYVEELIKTAILYHEPRIDAEAVTVEGDQAGGLLTISVEYSVRGTNSRFNFVFPYYLDGTNG